MQFPVAIIKEMFWMCEKKQTKMRNSYSSIAEAGWLYDYKLYYYYIKNLQR